MATDAGSGGKVSAIDVAGEGKAEAADLEAATSMTGYGTFNVLLLLAALPIAWTGIFDTTTTAFVLASAECDLQLTTIRKGVLAASPFLGMTLTGFLWDHLTPHIGARNLFVLGLLADSALNVFGTAVESYYAFLAIKILSGALAGGPFSMVIAYLSEFHATRYNASFARWAGLAINAAIVVPAVAGMLILPLPLETDVFGRRYTSWRIYLLVCSCVPVLGLLTAGTLPQSPKHLVQVGKPEEALRLLRRIYALNKRKPAATFPVKELIPREPAPLPRRSSSSVSFEKIRVACYNAKVLLSTPYLSSVAFLVFQQFASMLGFHTMRLWVPHMFIVLNNFDDDRWTEDRWPTMCEMLDRRNSLPARDFLACPNFEDACLTWTINPRVYQNSAIIAFSTVLFSFLVGTVSTSKRRKRVVLLLAFFLSSASSLGVNWAQVPPYMLTLAASVIVTTRMTGNVVAVFNVDFIPPPFRSTSAYLLAVAGNAGAILGNVLFSLLLDVECLAAFLGTGILLLASLCLSTLYPKPARTSAKDSIGA